MPSDDARSPGSTTRAPRPLDPARASVRTSLFGGEGSVRVWALAPVPAPFTVALHCELDPGGRVGAHAQQSDDEIVIVTAGEGVLYVDGRAHPCVPGSLVALPLGARLEIDNASTTEPLVYLIVKARRPAEAVEVEEPGRDQPGGSPYRDET